MASVVGFGIVRRINRVELTEPGWGLLWELLPSFEVSVELGLTRFLTADEVEVATQALEALVVAIQKAGSGRPSMAAQEPVRCGASQAAIDATRVLRSAS